MAETRTNYYRTDGGVVIRTVHAPGRYSVEIWRDGGWVYFPQALGDINGTGGDGHAVQLTVDQARALIGDAAVSDA